MVLIMFIFRRLKKSNLKNKFLILLFPCLLSFFCSGQKLSRHEWCWALGHPVAAIKVKIISKKCFSVFKNVNKNELDTYSNGGKLDAFRHAFYFAAFAQKVKIKKLRKLGIAHEKTNYRQFLKLKEENGEVPDSLGMVMDLKNNELGLLIGSQNKHIGLSALEKLIIQEIKKGSAFIILRNKLGNYVNCNGETILETNEKKWKTDKCLVSSDKIFNP